MALKGRVRGGINDQNVCSIAWKRCGKVEHASRHWVDEVGLMAALAATSVGPGNALKAMILSYSYVTVTWEKPYES